MQTLESRILPVFGHRPLTVERGEGCYVIDAEGRRYLDFITGIGVNALGYSYPAILGALREQAELCIHTSNLHKHRYQEELACKLAEWSGLDRAFFTNSGAEAMEVALKVARAAATQRGLQGPQHVVSLENSFHGRTSGALAVTGQPKYRSAFLPLAPEVVFVPANDVESLREAAVQGTVAIVAETIQGEGGIYPLEAAFLAAIRETADDCGALWIADETQCGLGRTGERFAYQAFDSKPDIVVTAKPLGGGLPLGATLFSERVAATVERGMHGTTFGGGPLACRVGLAFLEEVDRLLPQIRCNGAYLHQRLRELQSQVPCVREVRGRGLMAGIELTVAGDGVVQKALDAGLVVNCTHGNIIRLLPPFLVGKREIDAACEILGLVLMRK